MRPTETDANPTTPVRGTIIVDAYVLKKLAVKVTENATDTTPPGATYLDTLTFLANHGYRIIIPEVASIIAGRMLASGDDLSPYLPNSQPRPDTQLVSRFLKEVVRNHIPNIRIESETGPAAVNAYCASLHRAIRVGDTLEGMVNSTSIKATDPSRIIARINRDTNTFPFCNQAIMRILEGSLNTAAQQSPIFVISGERALREAVDAWAYQHDSGVKELNIDRYLACLAAANLNQPLNLKPTRDSSEFVNGFMIDSGKEPQRIRAPWYDTIGRAALCRELKSIAAKYQTKPSVDPETPPPSSDRAARFSEKFRGVSGLTTRKSSGNEGSGKSEIQR